MTFDLENTGNQIRALAYEQPSLKKYGSMKEFTQGAAGSGGDSFGSSHRGGKRTRKKFNPDKKVSIPRKTFSFPSLRDIDKISTDELWEIGDDFTSWKQD